MFLPTTAIELQSLGWERPDVILVTGDAYIDSPHMGVSIIGRYLLKHGFKTAIIAQPAVDHGRDISRLGEPRLFWGVTAGAIDSMVANYTATLKSRRQDDYTPGGANIRPNRAAIVYTNLIRQYFKQTRPIVLGGIEASLRRIAHYDYWDNAVRRSILFDAKADILAYGMAEKTVIDLARTLQAGRDWKSVNGICYIGATPDTDKIPLPSFQEVTDDKTAFLRMSKLFHRHAGDMTRGLVQRHGDRYLIHNPPSPALTTDELDEIYDLDYERDAHPFYKTGEIRALDTIKQSITTHRGCIGGCNFCSIAVHQGKRITSRSRRSILREAAVISRHKPFNGMIYDLGGPTANMFGCTCLKDWGCKDKSCLIPKPCPNLRFGHGAQIGLLREIRKQPGVKKVFIASGIRPDLIMADRNDGKTYIRELAGHHVSGQIKLAPEHSEPDILKLMNKPPLESLLHFKSLFDAAAVDAGLRLFATYYVIAAHPGCTVAHMQHLKQVLSSKLRAAPEQVQIFTPTPATLSTAMYYCEMDLTGKRLFCEKNLREKEKQKSILRPATRGTSSRCLPPNRL